MRVMGEIASEFVSLDVADGVGTIRLDRPKMNAISFQVQAELREAAAEATERDDVRAVVLYGGEKVFAAGNDVKEMAELSYADMVKLGTSVQSAVTAVARIPKPVVAAITGYALGGGCELALAADVRFAAEDAQLGQPEVLLGIIPGAGGTQRLSRLIGPSRAKDLIFTGRFVKAEEALAIGLVDRVVPKEQVYDEAVAWAAQFSGAAALALRAAKESVDRGLEVDLDTGLEIERAAFAALFATADRTAVCNPSSSRGRARPPSRVADQGEGSGMFGRGNGTRIDTGAEASGTSGTPGRGAQTVTRVRMVLAQVVWLLFLVAALFLAVGALLIALDANPDNALVKFVLDGRRPGRPRDLLQGQRHQAVLGRQRRDQERPVQLGARAPPPGCSWAGSWSG